MPTKNFPGRPEGIISIHVTGKLSSTYNAALRGREMLDTKCPIEVVDSRSVSMGLGLIAILAARLARAGAGLPGVTEEVNQSTDHSRVFGIFDTLKYLLLGGRIGKAKALLGGLLNVKPLLTMRDGELVPVGLARTRAQGIERLLKLVQDAKNIQEVAIVHSTTPEEAGSLKERISSFLDAKQIHLSPLDPALGVYGGPGTLVLALTEKIGGIGQDAGIDTLSRKRLHLPSLRRPKPGLSCNCP